jgi:tRNA pseudouridine38-40 synthase
MTVAYRGTRYHGWQEQALLPTYKGPLPPRGHGIPTVQETLARAMGKVLDHPVTVVGSSRTDRGVHAKGQVAHFDTPETRIPPNNLRRAINHKLPPDIRVLAMEVAPAGFHAISWASRKRYQYFLWNAPDLNPFFHDLAWHRWQRLNIAAMQEAASYFEGTHDFASFCRPTHKRETTERSVLRCHLAARGPRLIFGVEGTGFLWNMVRIMVGTMVQVGLGAYPPAEIARMIEARNRRAAGPTAPPEGLYLQWIQFQAPSDPMPDSGLDQEDAPPE